YISPYDRKEYTIQIKYKNNKPINLFDRTLVFADFRFKKRKIPNDMKINNKLLVDSENKIRPKVEI
ncbi:hypothetical protein AB4556_10715, partial [Vibrio splendidus]